MCFSQRHNHALTTDIELIVADQCLTVLNYMHEE